MNRFVFVVVSALLVNCLAKEIYFEFEHDPNYPQLISLSGVSYNFLAGNKYIEISATLTIFEEINDGTNVSRFSEFIFRWNLSSFSIPIAFS